MDMGIGPILALDKMQPKLERSSFNYSQAAINAFNTDGFTAPQFQPAAFDGGAGATSRTAGLAALQGSAGPQPIIQNFDIRVDLEGLEEIAEAGRFVSQLTGTRTLYRNATAGGNI
jgi:hypothetical protein